MEVIKHN